MYGVSNGLTGKGFGTLDGTPRDVSTRDPAQLDSAIIKESEINEGKASACGRTIMAGKIDIKKALNKAEDGGLPDIGPNGKIKLVAHKIDGDGWGPYNCSVDVSATGKSFTPIQVTVNVPTGKANDNKPTDYSLEAQLPNTLKCQGGADGQSCIIKCVNTASTGPYGGCMAFTQMQGLYNDPAPAGKGPSANFYLDRITENPVTRDPDLFSDARSKLSSKDLQAGAPPPPPQGKGKRRSVWRKRRVELSNQYSKQM
ncbi:hypothetical protein O181_066244 [Austropuccinia psidii MF-1]|uniref:Uncharacterized protein n=1 Tax=Austropuccinia psidii MF-1 TaxID=1389203 RepID=A0A9Q3ESN0_9BASI|nr:hypothetical protein [Austropuccinia psidii MF-1]